MEEPNRPKKAKNQKSLFWVVESIVLGWMEGEGNNSSLLVCLHSHLVRHIITTYIPATRRSGEGRFNWEQGLSWCHLVIGGVVVSKVFRGKKELSCFMGSSDSLLLNHGRMKAFFAALLLLVAVAAAQDGADTDTDIIAIIDNGDDETIIVLQDDDDSCTFRNNGIFNWV